MAMTNELSCYRYSAVLHIAQPRHADRSVALQELSSASWIDYGTDIMGHGALAKLLNGHEDSIIAVANVPFSKTMSERHFIANMTDSYSAPHHARGPSRPISPSQVDVEKKTSTSPIEIENITRQAGYSCAISCARQFTLHGGFDVIFYRECCVPHKTLFKFPTDHHDRPSESLCSRPWLQHLKQRLREDLYRLLQDRLPRYMIPMSLVVMERLPINDNGKVDRLALRAIKCDRFSRPRQFLRPPSSEAEMLMQKIWAAALSTDQSSIGLDDTFFQHGGNSITAIKVIGSQKVGVSGACFSSSQKSNTGELSGLTNLQGRASGYSSTVFASTAPY